MSIASRIESMTTHLQNDYDALESVVGTITEDKNIENIAPILDNLWEKLPHTTGTGTSLSLATKSGKMKVNLLGNTSQTGTPTPSSPIDVHIVSGDNTIVSTGKNLFDKNSNVINENIYLPFDKTSTQIKSAGATMSRVLLIELVEGQTYTIQKMASARLRIGFTNTDNLILDTAGVITSRVTTDDRSSNVTFTVPIGSPYFVCNFFSNDQSLDSQNGYENIVNTVQVEVGSTATSYEPYTSTSYPINLPDGMFLGEISTYKDSFFKAVTGNSIYDNLDSATKETLDYGEWYLEKKIGKVVLDGSENWNNDGGTQGNNYRHNIYYLSRMTIPPANGVSGTYLSNYFVAVNIGSDSGVLGSFYISEGWLVFPDKNKTYDLAGFKTWLSTHNTSIYYQLATPTYTQITGTYDTLASQLEAVWRANSYKGTTNILQVNNDLPFNLDITALEG